MSKGTVTFAWSKFPKNLGVAIVALSFVTWFDIWPKPNWFGQFLMMTAILPFVFQPKVSVKSDKIKLEREDDENGN